jgi:hypothetical protein
MLRLLAHAQMHMQRWRATATNCHQLPPAATNCRFQVDDNCQSSKYQRGNCHQLPPTATNCRCQVEGNYQSGASQLQQAKKIAHSMSDRFAIFVREQEAKTRGGDSSGEGATDLVSYVEFQRNYTVSR